MLILFIPLRSQPNLDGGDQLSGSITAGHLRARDSSPYYAEVRSRFLSHYQER